MSVPTIARAASPPPDDEPMFAPQIEIADMASEELIDAPSGSPFWLSIAGGAVVLPEKSSFNAMLLLGIPLDRIGRRRGTLSIGLAEKPAAGAAGAAEKPTPGAAEKPATGAPAAAGTAETDALKLKPAPRARGARPEGEAPKPAEVPSNPTGAPAAREEADKPIIPPVVITPELARKAVRAALKRARLEDPAARVDELASRARTASLLPELRFRVSRLVDEGQSLSPTEYDPGRITATGGTSLWLEARATWRLDKVVFGDDEVALERMRHERAEAQAKLTEKVLELLFAWQRAEATAVCPGNSPEEQLAARLKAIEAKASLDILTGGARLEDDGAERPPPR